jgi:ABC-type glycerol-3-phosphate transport system permease component
VVVFSALLGAYYNATLRFKLSYVIWVMSNLYLMVRNFRINENAQATMYVVYLIINIIGLRNTIGHKGWLTPKK